MKTNAQSAAMLLRGAASFFRDLAGEMPSATNAMLRNASVYERLADAVEIDPLGKSRIPVAANDDQG